MYLYTLEIGQQIETLDHYYCGAITDIAHVAEDDRAEDAIEFVDANGELHVYPRWMVRRVTTADLADLPPF